MAVRISLAAKNVDQWRDLAKRMRKAGTQGQGLRKQLRQRIAEAGQPVLEEVQAAVRDLHVTSTYRVGPTTVTTHRYQSAPEGSHGGGRSQRRAHAVAKAKTAAAKKAAARRPSGLREAVARATKLQQTTKGIKFVVRSNLMPPSQQTLPRRLDSAKGWRHPLFGRTGPGEWFTEKGEPYFGETIKKRAPKFRESIVKAMDDIQQELEG